MLTFLSPDWIEALDRAGRPSDADDHGRDPDGGSAGLAPEATEPGHVIIEQRVLETGRDDIVYVVSVTPSGIRVHAGPAASPDVVFTLGRATAAAIAQGTRSAQAAFMAGDLRLDGNTAALLQSRAALTDLADRFAAVRDETEW